MDEQLKKNIGAVQVWIRLAFMLMFAIVLYAAMAVYTVLVVVQFLFVLLTTNRNINLAQFADVLCQYMNQCLRFISFSSDDKPFPFADLPVSDVVEAKDLEADLSAQDNT